METFSTVTLLLFEDRWLVNRNSTTDYTVDMIRMQLVCAALYQMCNFCMMKLYHYLCLKCAIRMKLCISHIPRKSASNVTYPLRHEHLKGIIYQNIAWSY